MPGSQRSLARYMLKAADAVCNLDDPQHFIALGLRPSDAVSRDYAVSRAWARRIHELWDLRGLSFEDVTPLRLDHLALVEASNTIVRRIAK